MRRNRIASLALILLVLPALASAQDAKSIFEKSRAKQLERWAGVDVYLVDQTVVGNSSQTYFQRTEVTADSGDSQTLFLPVTNSSLSNGNCVGAQSMTAEQLETFAVATEMTGSAVATEIEGGLEEAGLPPGLLAASGSDPTATFDPRIIMGANAEFLRGAAAAKRDAAAADPGADASEAAEQMAQFIETAEVVGTETVDGRRAFHLRADDVGAVQEVDGRQYEMKTMSLWVDASEYVVLQMKIEGTLAADGEVKPMTIENKLTDYRDVPGSNMYEPFKQIMKISGMMDQAQEAQMQEAVAKMAEFEQQLASMPESQRQMMEKMMGPQLEMMRGLASGGGFQTEIITNSITVNPEMAGSDGQACPD